MAPLWGPLEHATTPLVLTSHGTPGLKGPLGQTLPQAKTHLKVENFLPSSNIAPVNQQ